MRNVSALLCIFAFFGLSCSDAVNQYESSFKSAHCSGSLKDAWLRQLASHFISQNVHSRETIAELLDAKLAGKTNLGPEIPATKLQQLHSYFQDIITPQKGPFDGSSMPSKEIGDHVLVITPPEHSRIAQQRRKWPRLHEAYWNGWIIPQRTQVENFPLYRGDKIFTQMSFSRNILAQDSPLWPRLSELFSKGMYIDIQSVHHPLHQDVFEHTIDSSHSKFIASSKDFHIATEFGLNPAQGWSAIIEFRGDGIDVAATGRYFEKLAFLRAMPALMGQEKEVAIPYGVEAHNIRGLWLIGNNGQQVFIQNPNFKPKTRRTPSRSEANYLNGF